MHAMPKIQLPYFKQTGFTLIELLVVVAITSIVVGGSIAGFTTFAKKQEVLTATQEVRQLFVSAKTKAQVQETPAACDGDTAGEKPLQGYQVVKTGSVIKIQPLCGDTIDAAIVPASPGTHPSFTIPTGVDVSMNTIKFFTLNNGVFPASGQIITVSGNTKTYTFTISTGGAISDVQ